MLEIQLRAIIDYVALALLNHEKHDYKIYSVRLEWSGAWWWCEVFGCFKDVF